MAADGQRTTPIPPNWSALSFAPIGSVLDSADEPRGNDSSAVSSAGSQTKALPLPRGGSALTSLERARRAQQEHDLRIDVQLRIEV